MRKQQSGVMLLEALVLIALRKLKVHYHHSSLYQGGT